MRELKPCPFCGRPIQCTEVMENLAYTITKAECTGCGMEFEYEQDFKFSKSGRAAIQEPFEEAWNRRAEI